MKVKVEMTPEEMIVAVQCYEELKAYRKTGYTPEQVQELHDKHWDECRQIAHYENDLNSNRGWIPCSERMPESDVKVHVYAVGEGFECQFDAYVGGSGNWHTFDSSCREDDKNSAVSHYMKITHWMPLPEPPAEKGGVEE